MIEMFVVYCYLYIGINWKWVENWCSFVNRDCEVESGKKYLIVV